MDRYMYMYKYLTDLWKQLYVDIQSYMSLS